MPRGKPMNNFSRISRVSYVLRREYSDRPDSGSWSFAEGLLRGGFILQRILDGVQRQ
jgi:hypothetical protein